MRLGDGEACHLESQACHLVSQVPRSDWGKHGAVAMLGLACDIHDKFEKKGSEDEEYDNSLKNLVLIAISAILMMSKLIFFWQLCQLKDVGGGSEELSIM